MIPQKNLIDLELSGLYGSKLLESLGRIIKLYDFYDGNGQHWQPASDLDYKPSQVIVNQAKKLIKREARFMFGRTPEFTITSPGGDSNDDAIRDDVQSALDDILERSFFPDKLLGAARDCFIGGRVAIKLSGGIDTPVTVQFRPAPEFVFFTEDDDCDKLRKIIFFYRTNDCTNVAEQRIWKQKYEIQSGRCFLTEGVYDGYGSLIEGGETINTGLSFIPCKVIINDGLTGDMLGESDIAELMDLQIAYNRLFSDDLDALRFNMFPQRVAVDADSTSLENMVISPGALVDLMTDPAMGDGGSQANLSMLEAHFSYSERFEAVMNRIKNDMHDLLSVPNVGLEQLKGLMQSGKSMKALYWELIERCEEKWTVWEPALKWMCHSLLQMASIYSDAPELPDDYDIHIEHMYPILEDDDIEREIDMREVTAQVRSRASYIRKWNIADDADSELLQIKTEQTLLEDSYSGALDMELSQPPNITDEDDEDAE